MVFGSHRKIRKTFLVKKSYFFPRGKGYHTPLNLFERNSQRPLIYHKMQDTFRNENQRIKIFNITNINIRSQLMDHSFHKKQQNYLFTKATFSMVSFHHKFFQGSHMVPFLTILSYVFRQICIWFRFLPRQSIAKSLCPAGHSLKGKRTQILEVFKLFNRSPIKGMRKKLLARY